MDDTIINRVAESGIETFNLENYFDTKAMVTLDITAGLFMGMMLKEKDFRQWIKDHDWEMYRDKNVAIVCTADTIIPTWAYMLVASKLHKVASFYILGNEQQLSATLFQRALAAVDVTLYSDKRVVIKGCGDLKIPESAYVEISRLLLPVVKSLMFGEPCSTVPVYKRA